jgi:hypothetical protein
MMTSYVQGTGLAGAGNLDVIELRVISNILQREMASQSQEELKQLRNDQAFELGFVPPVVPGN